ncbi:MAG: N-acetylglucosamine kinase [Leadbetterella sp.]|nr:N-acetylglucosamine kinase [Leadbetterella sp.]
MILLAESGSTKTDWRLLGEAGSSFETIGLNPYFVNSDTVEKELRPHLSHETPFPIREVHFYGTGITDPAKGDVVAQGILRVLGQTVPVYTYSDVIAAARALFGDADGLACILGTGSNTCYWDGRGIAFQVPPLGFWLGDEGSGGHLGKSLILGYLHREMPASVRQRFEDIYGAKDRLEILDNAYRKERPNKYFAQFCPFLLENQHEPWCAELIRGSFRLFFEKYLLKYPQIHRTETGCVGSVAYYFESILKEVAAGYGLQIGKVIQKPIDELALYHHRG